MIVKLDDGQVFRIRFEHLMRGKANTKGQRRRARRVTAACLDRATNPAPAPDDSTARYGWVEFARHEIMQHPTDTYDRDKGRMMALDLLLLGTFPHVDERPLRTRFWDAYHNRDRHLPPLVLNAREQVMLALYLDETIREWFEQYDDLHEEDDPVRWRKLLRRFGVSHPAIDAAASARAAS